MASSSCWERKENKRSTFKTKSPHFFKIILDGCVREKKLSIPPRFVRSYGSCLSSPVILKVPGGTKWKVEIVKSDTEVWLQNGWQEFVEYFSIATGSFLVFQFDLRNHVFNVTIFDESATEIEYPFRISNGDDEQPNLKQNFQNPETETVDFLDDFLPCPKTKRKPALPFPLPDHKRTKPLKFNSKREFLSKASTNFKFKNPFFTVAIQLSYVYPGDRVTIPSSFAWKYFNHKQCDDAILNLSDGRTWSVKCYINVRARNGRITAKICSGWKAFAKDNHLEIGDFCVFELVKATEITFRVTIFPQRKGENKEESGRKKPNQWRPSYSSFPREAIEAAKKFTTELYPEYKGKHGGGKAAG